MAVTPRPAATVLLVRDDPRPPPGRSPLQIFLQRRVVGMAFAGGMTVFPGGGVDAADRAVPAPWADPALWSGPGPAMWGEWFRCAADLAGALVHAAVRETFEECGVLFAGPGPVPGLHHERAELVARRRTLSQVLAGAGLVLRADLLRPWARWITPVPAPKRYDTAFFVATVPEGQVADAHTSEAVDATWWHPSVVLEHEERGELELMTPTLHMLRDIADLPDAASVLAVAGSRVIEPVTPQLRRRGDTVVVVLPGDPDFEPLPGAPA